MTYPPMLANVAANAAVFVRSSKSHFIMATVILVLGFYLLYPVVLILINSFNVAEGALVGRREWGLENWRTGFDDPRLLAAFRNTFLVWGATMVISFPASVAIAWVLARTRIPFSHGLEFLFWVSYMLPGIATTIAWIGLMSPGFGTLNQLVEWLPFVDDGPFNIFSVGGIVWAHLMANGISVKVMILTPAFRNMDASLEEAARVSGASDLRTMFRITLPLLASPMALVFALQLLRIFQSFEIEQLIGVPFGFFVYSTLIYDLMRQEVPDYGRATVLASLTLAVVALIIPLQRWILQRRRYTTITGTFKPGLVDLGRWNYVVLGVMITLLVLLTAIPAASLVLSSVMNRMGWFDASPVFSLRHWTPVLTDTLFLRALRTTLVMSLTAAILSPLLFSLVAYILVRTRWRGRFILDSIIWGSAAIPGMLTGLGLLSLFLGTPGLSILYGSIWALIIVVIIQGNTTGTNVLKGVFVQVGNEMEEAARISGAGWIRTYIRVWIPLLMPTLVLLAVMNFVTAANVTSSIILVASRDVMTLSLLALELASPQVGRWEAASAVSMLLIVMTIGLALVARYFGVRLGVRHPG